MASSSRFGLIVHGGAGSLQRGLKDDIDRRRKILRKSVSEGYEILRKGDASLNAVEAAVRVLEDSGIFNAGKGSCTTIEGKVEPDAALMLGDLRCGAVAGASMVSNPISLARACMEKTDHVFLAGEGPLRKFAKMVGFEIRDLQPNKMRMEQFEEYMRKMKSGDLKEWPKNSELLPRYVEEEYGNRDTVGAVGIDSEGMVCAGVSTGGRFMKLPGRVGDSPIPGAGLYADSNSGASVATGAGEDIIRVSLCKTICDFMREGLDAQAACDASISLLTKVRGPGIAGVIGIDSNGEFGLARNTEMMPVSLCFSYRDKPLAVVLPEEYGAIYPERGHVSRKLKM
jgi:L-asparaginase / beta-aspartyl-peptidase